MMRSTNTQAELMQRARLLRRQCQSAMTSEEADRTFARALQSEREAAAPRQVAYDALLANLRDYGVAFRMIRDAVMELSPAVPPIKERDVGPPDYAKDAEEIIAGFSSAVEAAAAEARRAAIEDIVKRTSDQIAILGGVLLRNPCRDEILRELIVLNKEFRAIASPAPQEKTRPIVRDSAGFPVMGSTPLEIIATLRDSRDTQKALAQRYWNDLQTARAEITALTKERDAMKAVVEAARECEHCWLNVMDSLGPPQKGWWKRLELALPKLTRALAALATESAA